MNCNDCKELMVDFVEGLLPPEQAQEVAAHLKTCPTCRDETAAYGQLRDRLIVDANALVQVPMEARVMDGIFREQTFKQRKYAMRKRYGWIGVGLAAAVALAIISFWPTRSANAAEELRKVARAYNDYRGWIHVTFTRNHQPITVTHFNTSDNTFACIWFDDSGQPRMYEYDIPATGQQWVFTRGLNEVRVGMLPQSVLSEYVQRISDTTSFPKLIELFEAYAGPGSFNVRQSREGAFDRFDLTWRGTGREQVSDRSFLVDPQSRMILKLTSVESGITIEQSYSYGEPSLSGIYDLGVPRETPVVSVPDAGAAEAAQATLPIPTVQPATLNRDGLLRIAENTTGAINDLQVIFTFNAEKPLTNMMNRCKDHVITKGNRFYRDRRFSFDLSGNTLQRILAYNGQTWTLFTRSQGDGPRAVMTAGDIGAENEISGMGFYDLNLLNPPRAGGHGSDDQSLLSLLRNRSATVRENLEMVSGRPCHVVHYESLTAWLDAERGCVVMRQVYTLGTNSNIPMMVFITDAVAQVAPGFCLATYGRKINYPIPGIPELAGGAQDIMAVDDWSSAQPALQVNTGLDDTIFDLWNALPPGTEAWDKDQNKSWIVPSPSGNSR